LIKFITPMKKYLSFIVLYAFSVIFYSCEEPTQQAPAENKVDLKEISRLFALGRIEPEGELVALAAKSGGVVKEVFFSEGQQVDKDALLCQLEDELDQARIRRIESQIATQEAQVLYEQAAANEAEVQWKRQQEKLAISESLFAADAETKEATADLRAEVAQGQARFAKAMAGLEASRRKLGELAAELATARLEAGQKQLRAPEKGQILKMHVQKGGSIGLHETYADFAPDGELVVRCEVDELFADRVANGLEVKVKQVGKEEVLATGKVVQIAPSLQKKSLFSDRSDEKEDRRVRELLVAVPKTPSLLLNSQVECEIILAGNP
jgi:multidrug resistance efflux pump